MNGKTNSEWVGAFLNVFAQRHLGESLPGGGTGQRAAHGRFVRARGVYEVWCARTPRSLIGGVRAPKPARSGG
jgi:hypothetical protein